MNLSDFISDVNLRRLHSVTITIIDVIIYVEAEGFTGSRNYKLQENSKSYEIKTHAMTNKETLEFGLSVITQNLKEEFAMERNMGPDSLIAAYTGNYQTSAS